ncbi:MAG: peptidyl-prolyl cis-trans isomerase [Brevundimonas sp.]|uniref:peptidyl-prolyl cis-trans isomerase n=1 Tax=Brevundimonas sp. TaxID=1871086 RepID=UPI00182A393D|nr:peptidyl-prolyl cis-trans isomerase [Brevundimonas sp.]MBA4804370.1 peptidyl-prolyl cis-trans isomerase [Brevundimonas sp.]
MLSVFRNFAKSPWAIGLLVLLALGLLITGGSQMDILANLGPRHVITAGDRSVDAAAFRTDMERIRASAQQQSGQAVSFEQLVGEGGELVQYLEQRSQQLGFMAWAWNAGVRPGKELVLRQIRQAPGFFDSVTGRFSEEQYRSVLAENNATPEMFEEQLRDEVMTRHFGAAVGAGARLPRIYGAVLANQAMETRDGRWFTVTQAMAGRAPAPTDAQLAAFMQQNAERMRLPEFRSGTLVLFDNPADAPAAVSEADIRERFEFRREALSQPERRTFTTLTAPTRAAAERIAAALRAGQTPAAVGQANNLQPAEYADTPRSAVSDPAVAAAVFGLNEGQVSDPVQARVGFVVARVTGVTPGQPATLEDVREQVIQELRQEAARAAVYERVEAYDKARQEGKSLEAAVAEVGARTLKIPPVTRDGRSLTQPGFTAPPQLLESMWSLGANAVSEVVEAGGGQYFVVRVDEITPPALPSLSDPQVRAQLATAWTARENARLLSTRVDALAARVRRGEDLAAVARSVGAEVNSASGVSRQDQARGQGVLAGLFTTARNEVFSQQQAADSFVIGRTDRITPPNPTLAAPMAEQFRTRMGSDNLNALGETAIRVAADRVGAEYDLEEARRALGLPATPAAADAAPAAGSPAPAQ